MVKSIDQLNKELKQAEENFWQGVNSESIATYFEAKEQYEQATKNYWDAVNAL